MKERPSGLPEVRVSFAPGPDTILLLRVLASTREMSAAELCKRLVIEEGVRCGLDVARLRQIGAGVRDPKGMMFVRPDGEV